jgi:hypothetical protein
VTSQPAEPYRPQSEKRSLAGVCINLNPGARSFWMTRKLSSIVILNLIANLPFLYHKAENRGDLH